MLELAKMESMDDVCGLGLTRHNLGDDTTTQKWPSKRLGEEVVLC